MNNDQFGEIVAMDGEKNIWGQFIGVISVTDPNDMLLPEYRKQGIIKISQFIARVNKKDYYEMLNTSTGAVEAGINFDPLGKSPYRSVAFNTFCAVLKRDEDERYFFIRFGENDSKNRKAVYIDKDGNVLDSEKILAPEKPGNFRKQAAEHCGVICRSFKLRNIARMKIGGKVYIDPALEKYLKYVEE